MTDYQVGEYVRLDLSYYSESTDCECAPESRGCWHRSGTTIRRVFQDGGLLLENRHGFVQVAQPYEVCR